MTASLHFRLARPMAALLLAMVSVHPASYPSAVLSDSPLAYYRFDDPAPTPNINQNRGSLGTLGNATNINVRPVAGAIAGSRNPAAYFDSTARAIIPWQAALNPGATESFTVEAWFYPTSDKVFGSFSGPAPIMNRYSYPGVDRQGWVYFQRSPDSSYPNSDGVGWNFRTYTGNGGSTGINITSQVPYRLGEWQHVVTVWDGPAQTATMFIDGVQAASQTLAGGYVANTGDHPASEAVNGPAGLSLGAYNNTEAGSNPFRGAIDEFAFYDRKLTPEQILAHYQNGTNATRATPYEQLILSDEPIVYLRLDDPVPGPGVAVNMGLLQNAGMATNTAEVRHTTPGALAGETGGAFAYHWRNGSATTLFPWLEEHNPTEWEPFTIEVWLRPTSDRINPGASPINNRYVASGNRTGWIFFQRAPNDTPACPVTKGWDGTSECLPAPEEGEAA